MLFRSYPTAKADIFRFNIVRPKVIETTALGAAYLAALAVGYYESVDTIKSSKPSL